jgi:hypothetical protein
MEISRFKCDKILFKLIFTGFSLVFLFWLVNFSKIIATGPPGSGLGNGNLGNLGNLGNGTSTVGELNSIKLYIYPTANYNNLGNSIEVGTNSINTSDDFNKFYNISPLAVVLDKSFYRLEIPAINNINLTFTRLEPQGTSTQISGDCQNLGGYSENNRCIVYGMINSTLLNRNNEYELWQVSARDLGSIYFYIISSSTAINRDNNKSDQYYLLPLTSTVNLNSTTRSSQINYQVYYKKFYCPNITLDKVTSVVQGQRGIMGFNSFIVDPLEDFRENLKYYIVKTLTVDNRATSDIYRLFLSQSGSSDDIRSNIVNIIVNNQQRQTPTLSLTCSTTPLQVWVGSSTLYILSASSSNSLGNSTFTLSIYNEYLTSTINFSTSSYIVSNSYQVSTSVVIERFGTYTATANLISNNSTTQAICSSVNADCQCVYRTRYQGTIKERRCQQNGTWGDWMQTSEFISNCHCGNLAVRNRYGQFCSD